MQQLKLSSKTKEDELDAGDGTTTSTILARAVFSKSLELIEKGLSPVEVKRGLDKACEFVCGRISRYRAPS